MALRTSLTQPDLASYLANQIGHFFPDGPVAGSDLAPAVARALERIEFCFARIRTKNYFDGESSLFDHLHGDQYAQFLYFVSHALFRSGGDTRLASKVYALNKALHALDVFYEVELPDVFCWQHPVGTVLGRGKFQDYLFVYQRVTVGGNLRGVYPRIGRGVCLFGDTAVTGDCTVGDNVYVSLGTKLIENDVPSNVIAFGTKGALTFKPMQRSVIDEMFHRIARRA